MKPIKTTERGWPEKAIFISHIDDKVKLMKRRPTRRSTEFTTIMPWSMTNPRENLWVKITWGEQSVILDSEVLNQINKIVKQAKKIPVKEWDNK